MGMHFQSVQQTSLQVLHLAPSQRTVVRIQMLGGFSIMVNDQVIDETVWRRRKAKTLIKLLALAPGHRLHREQLLDLVWPDLDPDAATNNLYVVLHAARRILNEAVSSPTWLALMDDHVVLAPHAEVWDDVAAFDALAAAAEQRSDPTAYTAALEVYRGDLLPEDRYEPWVERQRDALQTRYVRLLLGVAELHTQQNNHPAAIDALQRVVACDLAHEEAHARLMQVYALSGHRALALRQYMQLCADLRRELDAEPEPSSEALYQAIRDSRFPSEAEKSASVQVSEPVAPTPPHHNLPLQLTSFVGRERELTNINQLLSTARMITLTGFGGSGKTRLALQAAWQLVESYRDGVWFVDLARLNDAALVPQAIGTVLDVREDRERPMPAMLTEALRSKRCLLILDNCEHVIAAVAQVSEHLLQACPDVTILATSREVLKIQAEHTLYVAGLGLPEQPDALSLQELAAAEAISLLLARVQNHQPSFVVTPDTRSWIVEICQRLDGIPLALELAAARVPLLGVEQVATRLEHALQLLTGGSRTAAPRHRTLRATLEWSYALLSPVEQRMLQRLAVFAGGWTLDAAEVVGVGADIAADAVLSVLTSLVEKSLVASDNDGTTATYRLLQPAREFGLERLAISGGVAAAARAHAEFYYTLAQQAEQGLRGAEQQRWLERLEREHDNVRAALRWTLTYNEIGLGLSIAAGLWRFWYIRGYINEGREWLETLLAHPDADAVAPSTRAYALKAAGTMCCSQGEYNRATAWFDAALDLARTLQQQQLVASVLNNVGILAWGQSDYRRAITVLEEALLLSRVESDTYSLVIALSNLGSALLEYGDWERAAVLFEEGLIMVRQLNNPQLEINFLTCLGGVALAYGHGQRAQALLEQGLTLARELGDMTGMAFVLHSLGEVLLWRGDHMQALVILNEALALQRQTRDTRGIAQTLAVLALHARLQSNDALAAARYTESLILARNYSSKVVIAQSLKGIARILDVWGNGECAARLWGAADALSTTMGYTRLVAPLAIYDQDLDQARSMAHAGSHAAAWAAGQNMELDEAITLALASVTTNERSGSTGALGENH